VATTWSREDATRISIGHLKAGQHAYLLRSGKLVYQGTVQAVTKSAGNGHELTLLKTDGTVHQAWGGSATQYYVPKGQA
jgi:hypothetical protein